MPANTPKPGETPDEFLRRWVREWWDSIVADRSREGVLLHLPQVDLDPTDSGSVEMFVLTLAEAPRGAHLAVSVSELDWPWVERVARKTNPDVHVHWTGHELAAAAPMVETRLYPPFLHRWVWEPAARSWSAGLYRQGVLDAATSVEEWVRRKLALPTLTGTCLYDTAFGLKEAGSRLRFTTTAPNSTTWKNRQQAAKWLGKAATAGIRNLAAHATDPIPAQLATEYLAVLSVLARWAEEAELVVDGVRTTDHTSTGPLRCQR